MNVETAEIYQQLIEQIEDYAILFLDGDGYIVSWNKGAEKIKGYHADEIIGTHFGIFYTDEERKKDVPGKLLQQARTHGKALTEGWRKRKDGTLFWGSMLITAIRDEDGNISGFSKITRDLTERKRLEEQSAEFTRQLEAKVVQRTMELEKAETRYRHMFMNNPLPMWIIDIDTFQFLEVNEVAETAYGYTREEFLSMTALDIRPEEDRQVFHNSLHPLKIDKESYYRGIWRHRKKDGTVIEVEVFAHDIESNGRNARLILSQDITQRRVAEKKLASRVRYFRALLENNYDAILLHNEEGNIFYQSPATERVTGYGREETNQLNIFDLFHHEDRAEAERRMEEVLTNPSRPVWMICRMKHRNGYYIWVEGTMTNLLNDDSVSAIVGNFRDITDRKISAEQLMKSKRDMEKVYREQVILSERLSSIFNALPANIALINREGLIVAVNDAWRRFNDDNVFIGKTYGIDDNYIDIAEQYAGKDNRDGKKIAGAIKDILAGRVSSFSMEYCHKAAGKERWLKVIIVKENYGSDAGLVVMHLDISDRVNAEAETRRQKVQLERLLRGMGDAFVTLDGDWHYTFANEHALALMGKEWEDLQGKTMWEIFPDIIDTGFEEHYRSVMTNKQDTYFEIFYPSYNMWLDVRVYPHEGGLAIFYADISVRKEAQKKLYESEHKFRALIENSADFLVLYDKNLKLVYCSPSVEKEFGVKMVDIAGTSVYDNIYPADLAYAKKQIQAVVEQPGKVTTFTLRKQYDTEQLVYLEGTLINLLEDDMVAAVVCNYRDITSRRLAEQQLEASYRDIERLLLHTDEAFIILNTSLEIVSFNQNASSLSKLYLDKELAAGISIFGLAENSRTAELEALYGEVLLGAKRETESTYTLPDKSIVYNLNLMRPIYGAEGKIEGVFVTIRDITEKKAAERKIEFDRNNLAALINNTNDLLWSIDKGGRLITSNRAFDDLVVAMSGSEVKKGEVINSGFSSDSLGRWKVWYDRAFAGEVFNAIEYTPAPFDRWAETSFYPIRNNDDVVGVACFSRDITERIQSEQKLINANRLYAFISAINQTIVHATSREEVFEMACRIAVETGKFKMAWIGIIDGPSGTISLAKQSGMTAEEAQLFTRVVYEKDGPADVLLNEGTHYFSNNVQEDPKMQRWHEYARASGVKSIMVLPVKNKTKVVGTFNLYASDADLFNKEEVTMLEEVAGDISFALEVFDKEKERQEAVTKLLENEARLMEAQEIGHLGNWEIDLRTGKQIWSVEAKRIIGLEASSDNYLLESYLSTIHPEHRHVVPAILNDSVMPEENSFFNYRIIRANGEIRHIYSESKCEFDENGEPVRLHGIVHDVTNARHAEEALAQSEGNLRLLMDLIPQCIYARDVNGKFLFVNKGFGDLVGLSPNQLISRSITDVGAHEEMKKMLAERDEAVLATGEQKVLPELELEDKDGNVKTFYAIKVPYKLPGSKDTAVLGIAMDITERKHAEEERTKMVADIVQRNKELEQFSYIVSHNLRAPVANIIGISDLMQFEGVEDKEKIEMMGDLAQSVGKLDSVIKDLNYILQVKQEYSESRERVVLADLVKDIKQSIKNLIDKEQVTIITDFKEVPEINTLKSYMFSIFYNLISNSVKYRRQGVPPVIEIRSKKLKGNKYSISFKDNGLGIDLVKRQGQVFGLYKRFHSHTEGKGVGLYMVKTQVETLGGRISIQSEVNIGTEFTIELEFC